MSNASTRRTHIYIFLILANFGFLGIAHGQIEVWLAPRIDGAPGAGTPVDPYDVSTQQKFDALLAGYYKTNKTNITFHLAPGTYYTLGSSGQWGCLSNWKFHGAGLDTTVVKMSGWACFPKKPYGGNDVFAQAPWFRTGIEITDMTIDCSWLDFGSKLARPFTVPAPGQDVPVSVLSSTWASVGKYAYLQRMDSHKVVGVYEVTSITDGTNVVLRNLQGTDANAHDNLPHGTLVSGPVFVGPAVNTCGIAIGAKDCKVERVRVTDSGTPINEKCIGILLQHINNRPAGDPFYLADGNIIRDCIVDNLWGSAGWCISVMSNNANAGNFGTFISAVVEDNVIHSNGMHLGLSCCGTTDSTWSNNTVSNCRVGWFVDVGYNKDIQIINNIFVNNSEGIQFGGGQDGNYVDGWLRFNISGNHILVPQNGTGILCHGQVHQCVFANNQILAPAATTTGVGFSVVPFHTDGNVYSNNVVSSVLKNTIPSSTGYGYNNITVTGSPITMSGTSPLVDHIQH